MPALAADSTSLSRCKDLAALLLPELGGSGFGLRLLGAARGEAASCPLPISSSSPLAVCLRGQGHLKATAGQTSPPCHAVSCPAWVPQCHQLALLSPPSQMGGRCHWAGRLCGARGPGTCCYQAAKCRWLMNRGQLICSLQTSGRGRCCTTRWLKAILG